MADWHIANTQDNAQGLACIASDVAILANSLHTAFQRSGCFEPIWEVLEADESIGRSVLQFHVSSTLFDKFFNSPLGYRGFFRQGPWLGSAVNALIVAEIKSALLPRLSERVVAHVLKVGPKLAGCITLERSCFLRSLDPSLSKIWYSTAVVNSTGSLRLLPSGVSGEKLNVGLQEQWMKVCQDPTDCVIEVKGAFVGACGLFQVKDPEVRARTLSERGEA